MGYVASPLAAAVLSAIRYEDGGMLRMGDRGRLAYADGTPSRLTFRVRADRGTGLPYMSMSDGAIDAGRSGIPGLLMRGWRFIRLPEGGKE